MGNWNAAHPEYHRDWYAAHRDEQAAYSRDYYITNRERLIAKQRDYYAANHEEALVKQRESRAAHPDRKRDWYAANRDEAAAYWRKWAYGITPDQLAALDEQQGGLCAGGCGRPWSDVDHDHDCCSTMPTCGECTRGLLCRSCNKSDVLAGQPSIIWPEADALAEAA